MRSDDRSRTSLVRFGLGALGACVVGLATISATYGAAEAETAAGLVERPNIVLVIGDDHGWPYYGFMESPQKFRTVDGEVPAQAIAPTPNLDALAARGVVFTRGYSTAPLCIPSFKTLISASGLHAVQWVERHTHLIGRPAVGLHGHASAAPFFRTLPRELERYGYISWRGGKMWEGTSEDAGFTNGMMGGGRVGLPGHSLGRDDWDTASCGSTGDPSMPCPALEPWRAFLDAAGSRPFFAWVAPLLPHQPYNAPKEYRARFEELGMSKPEISHLANVRWFDEVLGEVLGELDSRGLRDNTLIIYLSDNGWGINMQLAALQGRGKGTPYDLGTRTPIIFAGLPNLVTARHDDLISTSDIVATILSYAPGARLPRDSVGFSLRPRLEGGPSMSRSSIITHNRGDAVLDPPWRYLRQPDGKEELYLIDEDPFEFNDLSAEHPDRVRALRLRADEHLAHLLQPADTGEIVGRLRDPVGEPIAGAQLKYGVGPKAQVVSTDARGWFTLGPWRPQATEVQPNVRLDSISWKGMPAVPALSRSHGILFEITGSRRGRPLEVAVGARIVVRVTDLASGEPVANAHVRARASEPLVSLRTYTDEDGYAWLEGLPVNRYRLTIKSVGHRRLEHADILLASGNDVARLSLAVSPRKSN